MRYGYADHLSRVAKHAIRMSDLSSAGQITVDTGWQLSPPPVPASIQSLEADCDPDWISYLTPFSPTSMRRPQSYVKYYLPVKSRSRNTIDQWVTPGWQEKSSPKGAVWTNELIHFVVDNCLPLLNDLMNTSKTNELYDAIVEAGQEQRQARRQGKDDRIWGRGLTDSDMSPWIISTIAITTEVKKLLPEEGTRWLFMRVTAKGLSNDRMDHEIILMDEKGELVALSHQLVQVVPVHSKRTKMSAL